MMRASCWHVPLILGGMMLARETTAPAGEVAAAASGQTRGQEPDAGPPSREEQAPPEAIEEMILLGEKQVASCRRSLDSCNQTKVAVRSSLDSVITLRRLFERDLEKA